jgi:FkbM family methyltransferase
MSHSQNDEEDLVLRRFGATFKGVCLDIGANDGITLSNTYACMQRGWAGVFVEPSPEAFRRLSALHQQHPDWLTLSVNAAITETAGTHVLYESGTHLHAGDVALLSSIIEAETKQWESSGHTFTPIAVDGITIAMLLSRCKSRGFHRFDLINIDAEGLDFYILRQIDLRMLQCQMLIVEHNGSDDPRIHAHANEHGMRLLGKNFQNLVFTR